MRAMDGRRSSLRSLLLATFVATTWFVGPLPGLSAAPSAHATEISDVCDEQAGGDPEDEQALEEAADERKQIQRELNEVLDTGELLIAEIENTEEQRDELEQRLRGFEGEASAAEDELAARVRRSYMLRRSDPVLSILAANDAREVVQQSHVFTLLAEGSRANLERASTAAERTAAAAEHTAEINEQLAEMRARYDGIEQRTRDLLAKAEQREAELSKKVALQRAEAASRCPMPPGQVNGGLACPVDDPHSYSDTWGAPRSGGRSHKGVDILAPHGTPIRAYENGTISRLTSGGLGGISLYLLGESGNEYYYTHLSGYVSGISTGDRVTVGQHIAYNGDTGNARGIPHLHWEVRPGSGGPVNPTPYADAACR